MCLNLHLRTDRQNPTSWIHAKGPTILIRVRSMFNARPTSIWYILVSVWNKTKLSNSWSEWRFTTPASYQHDGNTCSSTKNESTVSNKLRIKTFPYSFAFYVKFNEKSTGSCVAPNAKSEMSWKGLTGHINTHKLPWNVSPTTQQWAKFNLNNVNRPQENSHFLLRKRLSFSSAPNQNGPTCSRPQSRTRARTHALPGSGDICMSGAHDGIQARRPTNGKEQTFQRRSFIAVIASALSFVPVRWARPMADRAAIRDRPHAALPWRKVRADATSKCLRCAHRASDCEKRRAVWPTYVLRQATARRKKVLSLLSSGRTLDGTTENWM